jgi:sugar/nucleoside kinase (ribokinase family)
MSESIILIGSANTEQILVVDRMQSGTKSECRLIAPGMGGSAVNWAIRLRTIRGDLARTICVACPVGGDDVGEAMRKKLEEKNLQVFPLLSLSAEYTTSHSFILVCGDDRTVFTQRGTAVDKWAIALAQNISQAAQAIPQEDRIIVMIGNIAKANDAQGNAAEVTEQALQALPPKRVAYVYANWGEAQYSLCYHHWARLWNRIDCLQLNTEEARDFIRGTCRCEQCRELLYAHKVTLPEKLSLHSIMKFFIELKTTAVVTLAGSGSIAVIRGDRAGNIIFTWPRVPPRHVDPTGSGDAFGAGVIWSYLVFGSLRRVRDYMRALSVGSLWGALACGEYGGCGGIPDTDEIFRALDDTTVRDYPSMCRNIDKAEPLLYMLDNQAYRFV